MQASESSSANIGSVASATEELTYSVQEINGQVGQSREIAAESAQQAEKTGAQMRDLAAPAEKIGGIVSLISEIAGPTNVLALNATIEADSKAPPLRHRCWPRRRRCRNNPSGCGARSTAF